MSDTKPKVIACRYKEIVSLHAHKEDWNLFLAVINGMANGQIQFSADQLFAFAKFVNAINSIDRK